MNQSTASHEVTWPFHPLLIVIAWLSSNRNKLFKNVIFGMSAAILVTIATKWTNQQPHMRSHDLIHPLLLVIVSLSLNRNKLFKNVIFGMSAGILVTIATEQKNQLETSNKVTWPYPPITTMFCFAILDLPMVRRRSDKNRFKTPYITTIISFYWYIYGSNVSVLCSIFYVAVYFILYFKLFIYLKYNKWFKCYCSTCSL